MSNKKRISRNRAGQSGSPQIEAELVRVRQRANARLGSGISARAVQMMMSKLDGVIDEEEEHR